MKKKSLYVKGSVLGIVLGIMFLSSISVVYADPAEPTFMVEPQIAIEVEVGQTFTVNVTLIIPEGQSFTNLYGWEIKLGFNGTILECKGAELLPGHPFEGKGFMPVIDISGDFIRYACLVPQFTDVVNVTETKPLCQIEFNSTGLGLSPLEFKDAGKIGGTYLVEFVGDGDEGIITEAAVIDGEVSVIPEFQPLIMLFLLIIATVTVLTLRKKYYKKAPVHLFAK